MKSILGLVLIILGIVVGLYLGVWVMFIGGIIQIAKSIQPEVIAMGIAWGVIKILLATLVGWLSAICLVSSGVALINS